MRFISYSNVVATLALCLALGGSAYAAVTITGKQIKDNSVTTKDIKNRSLLAVDFKGGQLKAGPKGDTGAQGAKGDPGKDGVAGHDGQDYAKNVTVRSASFTSGDNGVVGCDTGERATGGGASASGFGGGTPPSLVISRPSPSANGSTPDSWYAQFSSTPSTFSVYVICAS